METENKPASEEIPAQCGTPDAGKGELPEHLRRSWRRRLIVLGVSLVVICVFHAPILRFPATLLIVSEPLTPTDVAVIGGSSGPYRSIPIDEVTELYQKGLVREILLFENRSSRIVQAGIVPTLESVVKRELAKRNVPQPALTVVVAEYPSGWDMARALRDWLEAHPERHVTVLCGEFESRCSAYILHTVLGSEVAQRVHIWALPDKRFDPSNWWHTRQGIVELLGAYVSLTHTYVIGEPSETTPRWNPDKFEKSLQEHPGR